MHTTVKIDKELVKKLKIIAIGKGITLQGLVEEFVRKGLKKIEGQKK